MPADAALVHLEKLRVVGVGWARIAELVGRSESWLMALRSGRRSTITVTDEQAIMSIPAHAGVARKHDTIPARGASRRLQALVARGYGAAELARRLGVTRSNLSALLHGTQARVEKRRFEQVWALYDELWDQQPQRITPTQKANHSRALRLAAEHGWVPPLAWDDIDRDTSPSLAVAA